MELETIGLHGHDVLTPPPPPTLPYVPALPDDISYVTPDDAPILDAEPTAQPVHPIARE